MLIFSFARLCPEVSPRKLSRSVTPALFDKPWDRIKPSDGDSGFPVTLLQETEMSAQNTENSIVNGAPVFSGRTPLPSRMPLDIARHVLRRLYWSPIHGQHLLLSHCSDFWLWDGSCYRPHAISNIKAELYRELGETQVVTEANGAHVPFAPNASKIREVVEALKAVVHVKAEIQPPVMLDESEAPGVDQCVSCSNGLLDLRDMSLSNHCPVYFNTFVLTQPYVAESETPDRWLQFLEEVFPGDDQSKRELQKWMGYCLTPCTDRQKILMLVGPPRSGKGTISRVLQDLLGIENIASPSTDSLCSNFGMQALIGKPLAVIADARFGPHSRPAMERMLCISGEDMVTIDRKYRDPITVRLPTKFMILSNEVPRLPDASGAFANRIIALRMRRSYLGREDLRLASELHGELAGIFCWAIEGLVRLREDHVFTLPDAGVETREAMQEYGSPVGTFVADCCDLDRGHTMALSDLFQRWRTWCSDAQLETGSLPLFARDLYAAFPDLETSRRRSASGSRVTWVRGIRSN